MDRVTGALRVVGNAGGLFHLRDGAVVAVDSPGSPGLETLLLSSGRIEESDWTAALVESVETRSLQAALLARGIKSTEVEDLITAVVLDGAFATAAGEIEECLVDESIDHPLLAASDGVATDLLLSETARRLDAIASLAVTLSPYRDRVVAAGRTESAVVTAEQREIIAHATGRRTARDMAFALGRSLYPVTVEISRMLGDGLLEIAPPATSSSCSHWGLTSLRPRTPATQTVSREADQASSLPTRRPGRAAPDSGTV
ncbi:hypothetical protein SK803_06755 [Lentzea sp. BCCO 10_0856]|uniref:Uncharacterized protein n=1 Tax=Lentzea miocenica TaxID=3095431 RepID=A0ABU4SVN6_9PSEU|nr:hypothetical protein [Lentzea sp. BCCO 10_0856]MDX8029905.1 hypothetical protein [Lentzea sp. BCCO 10_0856]